LSAVISSSCRPLPAGFFNFLWNLSLEHVL
jgi:hypothetical protein